MQRASEKILEPFAVFLIILGLGAGVIMPCVDAVWPMSSAFLRTINRGIWSFAAFCALCYWLIMFRGPLKSGIADCVFYVFLAILFAGLMVLPAILR